VQVTSSLFYIVGGEPVSTAKYVRVVEGSPYFNESWMKGKVVMNRGARYDSILLRLDLLENALHYLAKDRQEMIATSPVKSIILSDSVSGKEYPFVNSLFLQATGTIQPGWYQLLATGQVALFKRFVKTISENKPYGSATVEQIITTSVHYFVMVNSVFIAIKKFKELPDLLKDKKNELKAYITSKNLSGKSDADYLALISYYNGLVAK